MIVICLIILPRCANVSDERRISFMELSILLSAELMSTCRVSSKPGKPGKPGNWDTFKKNQGKPGKIREIFQKRRTNLEKSGKFVFLR